MVRLLDSESVPCQQLATGWHPCCVSNLGSLQRRDLGVRPRGHLRPRPGFVMVLGILSVATTVLPAVTGRQRQGQQQQRWSVSGAAMTVKAPGQSLVLFGTVLPSLPRSLRQKNMLVVIQGDGFRGGQMHLDYSCPCSYMRCWCKVTLCDTWCRTRLPGLQHHTIVTPTQSPLPS